MPLDTTQEEHQTLVALAQALVDQPRANLQELAKAIGVSKATLYRFCRTREQLIERLVKYATGKIGEAIETSELNTTPPLEALRRLTIKKLEHRELTAFLIHYWRPDPTSDPCPDASWDVALDTFFLRGQQQGVFRIDIAAPALTEIWVSMMLGLVDAERRGRIARAGLASMVERAFLHGAAVEPQAV